MKPPSFTIKRHVLSATSGTAADLGHYDIIAQDGSTLVCGFETIEQASDFIAKALMHALAANMKRQGTLADVLKAATSGPKS